mmetsp:Transcript_45051/g.74738  ORF Transcript_45051/g.74738 Transcript_45051/m.74738 type:complete len:191 (+) Transcript_45051:78-650(+)
MHLALPIALLPSPSWPARMVVMDAADRVDGMDAGPHPAADQPSPSLTPVEVVDAQLKALQNGDVQRCFRFASPSNKRATGPWQRFEMMVRQTPAYAPLVGCERYLIVGALSVRADTYRIRARVWPASGVSVPPVNQKTSGFKVPVLDYDWELSRQPDNSIDYTCASCWMVDAVMPDASPLEVWDEDGAAD